MKQLIDLTKDFKTSRPIFRLTKDEDGGRITAELQKQYKPTPEEDNVLSELVCDNYNEAFDAKGCRFIINHNDIAIRAMSTIKNSMTKFLEKNLEMRNPRQSKIYRWYYRSLPNDVEFNDVMVMVYKYMRSFCDEDMKAANIEHINNTIALLEAIMEKYEQK